MHQCQNIQDVTS